ncbi:MAG: oxidoreductase [Firmicutes bacterium]|nr:oxidoreductase [Clostridiales bacterium]MBQ4340714.1 oxidoreductase [Bacillota bacterium]
MKQTQAFLSTYTADVSGVCSALFELGGMTVMHDPSGCNSTYNTHDEPRWYDTDSLVFISALSEIEAIMGDDQKIIDDIIDAANQLKPAFIAIAGTPIPMMIGTDFDAIALEIEDATGIPTMPFPTNGMHSYISGAGMALAGYAKRMLKDSPEEVLPRSMNILGATPLDFSVNGSVASMKEFFEENGWNVLSTWSMGSSPEDLAKSGKAEVNLVISSVGLETAKFLKNKYGTPYVTGTPCGEKFNEFILKALEKAAGSKDETTAFPDIPEENRKLVIFGESITSRSLASALYLEYGICARVISPIETPDGILSGSDACLSEEDDITESLKGVKMVIGDPMYKPLIPEGVKHIPLPHEAYSGRIFRRDIPNLVKDITQYFERRLLNE